MSAPYSVAFGYGDHYRDFPTLAEAIAYGLDRQQRGDMSVRVYGDGAEGGYGDDGTGWRDGLTEDERETIEEAGL